MENKKEFPEWVLEEEEIHRRLLYLKSIGELKTNSMRKDFFSDRRLERSIKTRFGSVKKCLEFYNLESDRVVITKEGIIEKIKEYSESGVDMHYTSMIEYDSKLVNNATKKFNMGYNELLDYLGIEYEPIRKPFNYESIKNRLDDIYIEYKTISHPLIKKVDSSILFYCDTNYESFELFLEDMGYDSSLYIDNGNQRYIGFKFEKIVKEILEAFELEFEYNKYYNKEIRPDFQMNDNVWVDAKLSAWTTTIVSTIEKYTEHCNKLIIIYLRGNASDISSYDKYENVEFIRVTELYPRLIEIGREDLISSCQDLLNKTIEIDKSVTTERFASLVDEVTV